MKALLMTCVLASVGGTVVPAQHVPAELAGTWILRKGTGTSYTTSATGQTSRPNASIHSYTFRPDGTFEYAMLMQSSLYGCTTAINGFESGHFSVEAGGLRVVTQRATKSFADNCRPHLNERGPAEVRAAETLRWRMFHVGDHWKLCMARAGGTESCFLKQ